MKPCQILGETLNVLSDLADKIDYALDLAAGNNRNTPGWPTETDEFQLTVQEGITAYRHLADKTVEIATAAIEDGCCDDCDCDDEDDFCDRDPFYEVTCPTCGAISCFGETVLTMGRVSCCNCGEELEFDPLDEDAGETKETLDETGPDSGDNGDPNDDPRD